MPSINRSTTILTKPTNTKSPLEPHFITTFPRAKGFTDGRNALHKSYQSHFQEQQQQEVTKKVERWKVFPQKESLTSTQRPPELFPFHVQSSLKKDPHDALSNA